MELSIFLTLCGVAGIFMLYALFNFHRELKLTNQVLRQQDGDARLLAGPARVIVLQVLKSDPPCPERPSQFVGAPAPTATPAKGGPRA